jgi:hypothetical protein
MFVGIDLSIQLWYVGYFCYYCFNFFNVVHFFNLTLNVLVRPIFGRLGLFLVVFSVLLFIVALLTPWRFQSLRLIFLIYLFQAQSNYFEGD